MLDSSVAELHQTVEELEARVDNMEEESKIVLFLILVIFWVCLFLFKNYFCLYVIYLNTRFYFLVVIETRLSGCPF